MIGKKRFKRNLQILLVISITILLAVAALKFLQNGSWLFASFAGITAILVARTYWLGGSVHSKYLFPGVILLIFFHIYPAIYSGQVAFTNDSNGHQLSKGQAISAILEDSLIPIEAQSPINYVITIGNSDGKVFAVFEYAGSYWAGNSQSFNKLNRDNLGFSPEGKLLAIKGYQILDESLQSDYSQELQTLSIHVNSKLILSPSDFEYLEAYQPGRIYSEKEDQITDLTTKSLYSPNDNGQMVNSSGDILYPGWKINVGFRNFTSIINNSEVRRPLLAVLLWTFINAILAVFLSFIMGLVLALVFNLAEMKSKRIYRTVFITPLAIPSVLSILVWAGLFQTSNGVINRLFHSDIPWLTDAYWAKLAILLVEVWISFPYMFLITTGAIQAISSEVIEAADIDGASNFQSFTQIKLPLVLRTVGPLLVAAGAMALNNFGIIYLLTGGGPTFSNSNGNAGATDILISYTYKLAFNSQEGNNYGLASALSILNFVLIGFLSIYGLKRIKTMEGMN
ncbi:unannotated protein [freshwater metagenome]|uniref:Unannotated protein n=1 Tax=freshwater metagenome TaxID=449393 RepID=A0A6J7ENJ9_9ZZZZ|nr:ABC transporter permease subunit [Actinomycetota bacterium]